MLQFFELCWSFKTPKMLLHAELTKKKSSDFFENSFKFPGNLLGIPQTMSQGFLLPLA